MPTLNIEGKRVQIDDGFLNLTPQEQEDTVNEIASSLGITKQSETPVQADAPEQPKEKGWSDITLGDVGRGADNFVRGLADTATFGLADELSAKANELTGLGGTYDENLDKERQRDANGGYSRLAGQVGGALLMPGGAGGSALETAGRAALGGAAYGFGSGEGGFENRVKEAGTDAALAGAVGGIAHKALDKFGKVIDKKSVKTGDEIKDAANQIYEQHKANPLPLTQAEQSDLLTEANKIKDKFYKTVGGHQDTPAALNTTISNLENATKNNLIGSTTDLANMRSRIGDAAYSADGGDRAALLALQNKVDDLLQSKVPSAKDARAGYHQAKKIEAFNKIIQKAQTKVDTDIIGARTPGRIFAKEFENAEQAINRGGSPFGNDQVANDLVRGVARSGSKTGHVLNSVGRAMDPLGGGLGGVANIWAGIGTGGASLPFSAAGLVAGKALQKIGDKLSNKAVTKAELAELLMRAGVRDKSQLPMKNSKAYGILKALRDRGPYTAAISASDIARMNGNDEKK